jgi:pimeloyl-ACP methyl ester carboxylesterase
MRYPSRARAAALTSTWLSCLLIVGAVHAASGETSCHVDGIETPVTCVTLDVPRDYDRPEGATLTITAVIVPASTGRPVPDPLLVLSGGPGQSATGLAAHPLVAEARRQRDVVLFDIRGTGLSEPLDCDLEPVSLLLAKEPDSFARIRSAAAECAAKLGERVRHHTDREVMEDIERFRRARGYRALNLMGMSYGTRVAQHYIRAYGGNVRSVILESVTPVATSLVVRGGVAPDNALDKMLAQCASDAACAAAFPNLPAKLDRLLQTATAEPIVTRATDPVTGEHTTFALDYFAVSSMLRFAMYFRPSTELLPYAIDAAAEGNFAPLLGALSIVSDEEAVAFGTQLSMLCAGDWPIARDGGAAARTGHLMRDGFYQFYATACGVWPEGRLPAAMLQPFTSNVPALAISGEWDPITPPEDAERALKQFATSVHLVVPRGSHVNSEHPCVLKVIASFLVDPISGGRDHTCAAAMPAVRFMTGPSH